MSQVIAGLYEIQEQIGAGGGGIVYRGQHLRLKKQVVLKADKRTLDTGVEKLRREVDMLKDLSHTYIPQVYDYVQEDGVVYTVMDYIEGESLDKLLDRKQCPSQQQVIRWACQLLQALSYLHKHSPCGILHGDIKPANIMLRPNGDICLIDFNIALALGANGAVKVGFSRGYASPEHYGIYYETGKRLEMHIVMEDDDKTLILSEQGNKKRSKFKEGSLVRSTTNGENGILLDARSDIYSLGATLYHLLSGNRPDQDALKVKPLDKSMCSPTVATIVHKAMNPEADLRYQSAEEMLNAFLSLYKRDVRAVRHKRRAVVAAIAITTMFLTGGVCTFVGLKQLEQHQKALTLAEYSANALSEGDRRLAIETALQAIPTGKSILDAPVTAQAQLALTEALGVYDLSDGFRNLGKTNLKSAPFDIVVSPNGTYFAAIYAYEVTIFRMEDQKEIVSLEIEESALSDVVFLDEANIVYAGNQGITAYNLDTQSVLWTGDKATTIAISLDKSVVAAVNRDEEYASIYRTSDGTKISERSFNGLHMPVVVNDIFADPGNTIFELNEDGSLLSVSFHNGGLYILDLNTPENDLIIYEESDYEHFEGGFCGHYFAFSASKGGESKFELVDIEAASYVAGYESKDDIIIRTDKNGVYIANGNLLVCLDIDGFKEIELAYTEDAYIKNFFIGEEYILIVTDDNAVSFYDKGAHLVMKEDGGGGCDFIGLTNGYAVLGNRNEPAVRVLKVDNHTEEEILKYDARYNHDEARISQDGQNAMLFSNQGFCVYDMAGNLITKEELPDSENIYDQQFRRSGEESWLEVIWYDGMVRCYSATDGTLISESLGEKPAKDLYEEFCIDHFRIASSLHAAPEVYDQKSGKLIAKLEEDSYLTYVTKTADYIVTEYISAEGNRYGILLDEDFQKLAYLPGLCDVTEDMLLFDYGSGNLRQCRLYSLQELIALGETYISKKTEEEVQSENN